MLDSKIPAKIIAEVALQAVKTDVKCGTVHNWTHNAVGRLSACASITQDWVICGMRNEAYYLTGDYANRHNLRW